jgi:hypothetical protein
MILICGNGTGKGMMDSIHFLYGKWNRRVLVAGCLAMLILSALSCDSEKEESFLDKPPVPAARGYEGELEIEVNPIVPVHGKSKEFVEGLRSELISKYLDLGIFPENYTLSSAVYGQVTWGEDWVNDVQIYINNPYLLVMTSAAGKVNPVLPFCGVESVTYRPGEPDRIEAVYRDEQASRWFYYIYDYYDVNNGIVRLNFVNALDAGFRFAYVDGSKSANLSTPWPTDPGAVIGSVYRLSEIYHVGHLNKNNKSPFDKKAWIRPRKKDAETTIYIKLWRKWPSGPDAREDLAYVISLQP